MVCWCRPSPPRMCVAFGPERWREHFTSISPQFHLNFNSILPQFHLNFTSILPQFYLNFTSISSEFHLNFTSISPQFHLNFTSIPLQVHLSFTSISPQFHLNFTSKKEAIRLDGLGVRYDGGTVGFLYPTKCQSCGTKSVVLILWRRIHDAIWAIYFGMSRLQTLL
jgi:hypothetical protein